MNFRYLYIALVVAFAYMLFLSWGQDSERKKELVQAAEVERPHIQAALEKARREVDFHENNLRTNTQDREVASQCAEKIEAQLATLLSL